MQKAAKFEESSLLWHFLETKENHLRKYMKIRQTERETKRERGRQRNRKTNREKERVGERQSQRGR